MIGLGAAAPSRSSVVTPETILALPQHNTPATPPPTSCTTLKLLQWNAAQLNNSKCTELEILCKDKEITCLAICEYVYKNREDPNIFLDGFDKPKVTKPIGSKGIATYFSKDIKWRTREDLDTFVAPFSPQCLAHASEIDSERGPLLIWNIYVNPRSPKSKRKAFWNSLCTASETAQQVIILGDLNEKSNLVSPQNSNTNPSFQCILDKLNTTCLNDGTPTRIQWRKQQDPTFSTLDYTFASSNLLRYVLNWEVIQDLCSDHFPIMTLIDLEIDAPPS